MLEDGQIGPLSSLADQLQQGRSAVYCEIDVIAEGPQKTPHAVLKHLTWVL